MFRRPFGPIARPLLRRPRLLRAALADLHAAGALTDEEFDAAKRRLEPPTA